MNLKSWDDPPVRVAEEFQIQPHIDALVEYLRENMSEQLKQDLAYVLTYAEFRTEVALTPVQLLFNLAEAIQGDK